MANSLEVTVKESMADLKAMYKEQPKHLKQRIEMLMVLKKSEVSLSKSVLAEKVGVNHNSITKWRRAYNAGGLKKLLEFKRKSNKKAIITPEVDKAIEKKLKDAHAPFRSYTELVEWISDNFIKGINYHTVNKYVKRKYKTKLKVARKSNIAKDEKAVEAFKKTSHRK